VGTVALWRRHPGLDPEAAAANPDFFDLSDMFDALAKTGSVGGGGRRHTAGGPLGPDMLHRIRDVLSAALTLEVTAGRLTANPCTGLKLPSAGKRRSSTPDKAELAEFLPYLAGGGYTSGGYEVTRRVRGTAATVTYTVPTRTLEPSLRDRQLVVYARMVAAGPRPTEVSALLRGNYDRDTRHMAFLAEGVVKVRVKGEPERWEVATGETDKRRERVIELDPGLAADLDALLLEQDEVALEFGKKLGRRAYLFSPLPACSTFLTPNTASDGFSDAITRARAASVDLPPRMRLYDMRHFGITYLLRAGAAPSEVAVRFATSEDQIRTRYSHAITGGDAHLAEKMTGVWPQPVTPGPVVSIEERRDAPRMASGFLDGR
jgi:integrase